MTCAAAPSRVTRATHLEGRLVGQVDEKLRLPQRVLAYPRDTHLFDEVVARSAAQCAAGLGAVEQKARRPGRVLHLLLEAERPRVGLPSDVRRLAVRRDPDARRASRSGATAEPLHGADGEVDAERGDVERHDAADW